MNHGKLEASTSSSFSSRRKFLATGSGVVASAALAGALVPHVHAQQDSSVRLAIVGCGPRGRGALVNAMSSPGGLCKFWAVAELQKDKATAAIKSMTDQFKDRVQVPDDRVFIGFDAYRKAIDSLKPGDVVLLTTRAAFRPTHFEYAVSRGINVFMEKSFAADPGGIQRILKAAEVAQQKNLKIACGLQCRHSTARQALIAKIRAGEMGDIQFIRAYRMQSGGQMGPRKGTDNELLFQIRNSAPFLWSSAGVWLENMIHQVDECCWLKDGWPVTAHGMGGRVPHSKDCGQNFDNYSIEYTFADGAKALVNGRFVPKCYNEFATFAHGTKCAAQFSGDIHAPTVQMYKGHKVAAAEIAWKPEKELQPNPWQAEWDVFLDAIHQDKPHMEAKRAALSNLAGLMGRAAVHSGRVVTWEEMMASKFMFCPNVDSLTENSEPPIKPDAEGRYPAPIPGQWTEI